LHAAEELFWAQFAFHPMLPFCPFASLIFVNGDNLNAHGMTLGDFLEVMTMLNHTFREQPSEESNRGLPPTECEPCSQDIS
jgi:hypothetical protein